METLAFLGLTLALGITPIAAPPPAIVAQLAEAAPDATEPEATEEETEDATEEETEAVAVDEAPQPIPAVTSVQTEEEDDQSDEIGQQLRLREDLKPWHIVFGTATWTSMNVATILGFLHFSDRWGWTGNPADTGCNRGDPILGGDFCAGPAIPHFAAAIGTAVFFTATFTLGLFMPDPLGAAEGEGERGTLLRIHQVLRWGVLGGMIAQLALGFIVGATRSEPFETGRALAVTHVAVGATTWAMMTAQGIVGDVLAF